MPRRLRIWIVVCSALLLPAASIAKTTQEESSCNADEIHWTIMGPRSVAFDWRGTAVAIRYGLTAQYGSTATGEPPSPMPFSSPGPFRQATLTSLKSNTLYHYSIGSCHDHTFRTPPPPGSSGFTVDAEGDVGASNDYKDVLPDQRLIAAHLPAFVLILGDLTYGNPNGQAAVDQHFNDVMVWSQDAAYMAAWGNHAWDTPKYDDLRNYKGRFEFPHAQASPGAPSLGCCGKDWYWFDYGNVRFIAYPEPYTSRTWTN